MRIETDMMTVNLLRLCYNCDDAHLCETEEQCKACWTEQGLLPIENEEEGQRETKAFLQMIHA